MHRMTRVTYTYKLDLMTRLLQRQVGAMGRGAMECDGTICGTGSRLDLYRWLTALHTLNYTL